MPALLEMSALLSAIAFVFERLPRIQFDIAPILLDVI
jgi:hypothetical protein